MDWGVVGQAMFFLSVALLATAITIFVFAASLLGRAVEAHAKSQEKLRADMKEELEKQLSEADKHLNILREQCGTEKFKIDEAVKALEDARRRNQRFNKESQALKQSYKVFTVPGGVTYPACFFLSSMFLSVFVWGLGAMGEISFRIGYWEFYTAPFLYSLAPAALLLIGFGIQRLYSSLKRIEDVALTSEEAALKRMVEAFKIAQKELEVESKPELELKLRKPTLPIRINKDSKVTLRFAISLVKGEIARNIEIRFGIPKVFEFINEVYRPFEEEPYSDIIFTEMRVGYLGTGEHNIRELTVKAPSKPGHFIFVYWLRCERYSSPLTELQVEVTS